MKMPRKLSSESVTLHPGYQRCRVRRKPVTLTAQQFRILYLLMSKPKWVFTREQIVQGTRGMDYPSTLKSVDVAIFTIRKRIGPGLIEAARGVGYFFAEPLKRERG